MLTRRPFDQAGYDRWRAGVPWTNAEIAAALLADAAAQPRDAYRRVKS